MNEKRCDTVLRDCSLEKAADLTKIRILTDDLHDQFAWLWRTFLLTQSNQGMIPGWSPYEASKASGLGFRRFKGVGRYKTAGWSAVLRRGAGRRSDQHVQRQCSLGGKIPTSRATTFAGMERSRWGNSSYTRTLAGLSWAEPLPSLFIGPPLYPLHVPRLAREWPGDMDLLRVSQLLCR